MRLEEDEEEDDELQSSVLSVLGGEQELAKVRMEEQGLHAPETAEPSVSAKEPHKALRPAEFMQVALPMALSPLPIVKLDPPSTTSTPVPSTTTSDGETLFPTQGLQPPSILAPIAAEPAPKHQKASPSPLADVEEHSAEEAPEKSTAPPKTTQHMSSTELLCGGAAVVAIVGVVAYSAVAYCRK